MMSALPRPVVLDLLPLYLAGELSPESRDLVDDYLRTDAELHARVREMSNESRAETHVIRDLELVTVRRTRRMLAIQRWTFGLACAFTAIGLSITASLSPDGVRNVRFMVQLYPLPFGAFLVASAACWIAYYRMRRA